MKTISILVISILSGVFTFAQPKVFQENIISTGEYETHPGFSPSGDSLYFLKCLPDASFCAIYFSVKKGNTWSKPYVVPFSGRYSDADPFVTKDGKILYFVSARPIHAGDSLKQDWDIWKVAITKKGWGDPVHLGAVINSPDRSEFFPTLSDNGNLYSAPNVLEAKDDPTSTFQNLMALLSDLPKISATPSTQLTMNTNLISRRTNRTSSLWPPFRML